MLYTIKCEICNSVVGQIKKPQITEEDRAFYKENVLCENQHSNSIIIVEQNNI